MGNPFPDKEPFYIYRGEEGEAIGIGKHETGPKGGWVGAGVCNMSLPGKYLDRQALDALAEQICDALNARAKAEKQ